MAIFSHSCLEVRLKGHQDSRLKGMVLRTFFYGYIFTQLPGGNWDSCLNGMVLGSFFYGYIFTSLSGGKT